MEIQDFYDKNIWHNENYGKMKIFYNGSFVLKNFILFFFCKRYFSNNFILFNVHLHLHVWWDNKQRISFFCLNGRKTIFFLIKHNIIIESLMNLASKGLFSNFWRNMNVCLVFFENCTKESSDLKNGFEWWIFNTNQQWFSGNQRKSRKCHRHR